jgi:hypothetical protein
MTYPGLFSQHQPLKGRAWIKSLSAENRQVFVQIGLEEGGHGQKGGRGLYMKRGRGHMVSMGRIGAIATNSIKAWKKAMRDELEKEFGVTFDY